MRGYEYAELSEALEDADFIVSGVNSYGVRWAAETLAGALKRSVPIIAVTKGLDADDDGNILTLNRVYENTLAAAGALSALFPVSAAPVSPESWPPGGLRAWFSPQPKKNEPNGSPRCFGPPITTYGRRLIFFPLKYPQP